MLVETKEKNNEQLFLAGMVLSMFCWGLSWASGKVLSGYGEVPSIALFRFVITFSSLLFILVITGEKLTIQRKGIPGLLISAACMALYTYFFFKGLYHGKPGAGGVLVTTLNPIIAYGIMLMVSLRKPSFKEGIGLLVGIFAGAILLKIWDHWQSILDSGNLYFVLATSIWAVLSLFTSKSSRYGSPIAFSLWVYGIGSVFTLLSTSLNANIILFNNGDVLFWGNMLFSAVITTAFATTFFFVATTKLGASKASSFIFLVPLSAALGAWLFLGEVPQWHTLLGGVFGIVAVYMINKK